MNTTCASFTGSTGSTTVAIGGIQSPQVFTVYVVGKSLSMICSPVIIVLGTFGNVMSLIIMSRMTSGDSTVNMFFIALAVGDLTVLYTGTLPNWAEMFLDVRLVDKWRVFQYLFWIASSSSASVSWFLVCVTLQRAMSVVRPHRVNLICTRRRVSFLITGIAVFMAAFFSNYLFGTYYRARNSDPNCTNMTASYLYNPFPNDAFFYLCTALQSWLPFVVLVAGNLLLVVNLAGSVKMVEKNSGTSEQASHRQRTARAVTFTVLAVSLAFIVLTFPLSVYMTRYNMSRAGTSNQEKAAEFLLYSVSFLLADTNNAINFYLYCLTGRRFRQEFVKIICRRSTTVKSAAATSFSS